MLSIRMQRLGRKGHATYRVVVQDSRQAPTSGKYVALLGSYDPHTKKSTLVKDKAELFLSNGAQPSDRVVKLLVTEGVKIPGWVKQSTRQTRDIRNPDKLRRNRPAEEKAPEPAVEAEISETPVEPVTSETEVAAEAAPPPPTEDDSPDEPTTPEPEAVEADSSTAEEEKPGAEATLQDSKESEESPKKKA